MTKISDLSALTGASVDAANDLITAVDMSETGAARNKKMLFSELPSGIGLGTGNSPQFTAVNIGHATDTTVSRASAGDIAVEGNIVYRAGGTDVPVTDGGTGASSASGARTNLGATTVGGNIFTLTNPSAITFLRVNADNSVDALSASAFRTAIGAGTGSGSGDLLAANNLSDLANAATARTNLALGTADSPQFTAINIGHASDTTLTRTGAGDLAVEGNAIYRAGGTDVPVTDGGTGASTASGARTNLGLVIGTDVKAQAPSVQAVTSSATVTPTFSDDLVKITAQAAGLTLANPTGTAVPGWGMAIRIKDNGTARSISYGSQYRAIGVTLPTTTVISKTLYLGMIYNADDTKWDVVAVAQEA